MGVEPEVQLHLLFLSALQVLAEGACGDQGGYVLGWRGPQCWIQSQTALGSLALRYGEGKPAVYDLQGFQWEVGSLYAGGCCVHACMHSTQKHLARHPWGGILWFSTPNSTWPCGTLPFLSLFLGLFPLLCLLEGISC